MNVLLQYKYTIGDRTIYDSKMVHVDVPEQILKRWKTIRNNLELDLHLAEADRKKVHREAMERFKSGKSLVPPQKYQQRSIRVELISYLPQCGKPVFGEHIVPLYNS